MCKLIIGVQDTPTKEASELLTAQSTDLALEKHGIGAMVLNQNGKLEVNRSMTDYDNVLSWVLERLPTARLFALHTRTGTSGALDIRNVHFFEHDDALFAHNGFVSAYSYWGKYPNSFPRVSAHNLAQSPMGFSTGVSPQRVQEEVERIGKKMDGLMNVLNNCDKCLGAHDGCCHKHQKVYDKWCKLSERVSELELEFPELLEDMVEDNSDVCVEINGVEQPHILTPATKILTQNVPAKQNVPDVQAKKEIAKTENACDSLQFLENLSRPLSTQSLSSAMNDKLFTGMGFLYDKHSGCAYVLISAMKKCFGMTRRGKFDMFFSYEPTIETTMSVLKDLHGVMAKSEDKTVQINAPMYELASGVYQLKI